MVLSLKNTKFRFFIFFLLVAVVVGGIILVRQKETPAVNNGGISYKAGNAAERIAFLSQFGWKIQEDPKNVTEIIVPDLSDPDYKAYNDLQKKQDLDLEPYAGLRVKKWNYAIENYPGYENQSDAVEAELLIYNGVVIGGHVASLEPNGFLQGFDFPQETTTKAESISEKNVA